MKRNWIWSLGRPERELAPEAQKGAGGYGFVQMETQGAAHWTRRDLGSLVRESYMKNPGAYRAVRLVAESVADIPWLVFDGDDEVAESRIGRLLESPNARQDRRAFLTALVTNLMLAGNAYVERAGAGDLAELHLLRPDKVSVETDGSGWPVALVWKNGSARRTVALEGENGEPAAACHIRDFHPLDDVLGFAPLEAAATAIDIHNSASEWNKALIDNSARPSGALVYAPKSGSNLSADQFERLKTELQEGYQGARKAGRPLLLEGGLDWKQMGLTPKDMDFFEAKNSAAREIALAFGVPPLMLGLPGDNTHSNYKEANRAFFRLTVMPLANRLADTFAGWLGPLEGERIRLVPDADQVDALAQDREALWARVGSAAFLTEEEKRVAVGYQPARPEGNAA